MMKNKIKITHVYAKLCFFTVFFVALVFFVASSLFHHTSQSSNSALVSRDQVANINFLLNELQYEASAYFSNGVMSKNELFRKADLVHTSIKQSSFERHFDFNAVFFKHLLEGNNETSLEYVAKNRELGKTVYLSLEKAHDDELVYRADLYLDWVLLFILLFLILCLSLFYSTFKSKVQDDFACIRSTIKKFMSLDLDEGLGYVNTYEMAEINELLIFLGENQLSPMKELKAKAEKLECVFQGSPIPSILIDEEHKILEINDSFYRLWQESEGALSTLLDVHSDSSLIGEYIDESRFIWLQESEHKILLENGLYKLEHSPIILNDASRGCVLTLDFISDQVELGVVHKSIKLMEQGVWNTPIRVRRGRSPLAEISRGLENIRLSILKSNTHEAYVHNVTELDAFEGLDDLEELDDFEDLSDLSALHVPAAANSGVTSDYPEEREPPLAHTGEGAFLPEFTVWEDDLRTRLSRISSELSEHLESTVLLGYENILQKLQIVHKEMQASGRALSESTRFLNEVRAITLKTLLLEQSKGEVERKSIAKDINHDVDTVISLLSELSDDEQKTIDLFKSEISVAELRKDKAFEYIHNFETDLINSCLEMSDEIIRPLFDAHQRSVLSLAPNSEHIENEKENG
ncbi:hypothetical protein [Marinomonas algicola]|uniref:hypothetical protein n=1 Tax=Marinomonas algicola TaxID=2773454 RepID=UPI00174DE493|nr:hypothetical protein [Marinomonas algicola]